MRSISWNSPGKTVLHGLLCVALLATANAMAATKPHTPLGAAAAKQQIEKKGLGAKVSLYKPNGSLDFGKIIAIDTDSVTILQSGNLNRTIRYDQIAAVKGPDWTHDWRFYLLAPITFPVMLFLLLAGMAG